MFWLLSCKRNHLKNCTTTSTPTNYLQLLPPTNLQMIEGNQSHQQNITPPDCGETKHQKTFIIVFPFSFVIIIRQRKEYSRKCCNLSRRNLSRHCIRPTWHSKHFRKPAKKNWKKKLFANAKFFLYAIMLVIRYYWMMKFCLFF